jgi:hypothetical protein
LLHEGHEIVLSVSARMECSALDTKLSEDSEPSAKMVAIAAWQTEGLYARPRFHSTLHPNSGIGI